MNSRANIKTLVTRTALVNGTPRDGALFTREVLAATARVGNQDKPLRYAGRLVLRDGADAAELAPAMAWLLGIRRVRVGGSLSTMGACDIEITRLERAYVAVDTQSPVPLYLTSQAILVDNGGAPSLDFGAAVQSCVASGWAIVMSKPLPSWCMWGKTPRMSTAG